MAKKIDSAVKATTTPIKPAASKLAAKPLAAIAAPVAPAAKAPVARKAVAPKAAAGKTAKAATPTSFSADDIALRAYFIAEHRQRHGIHGDEHTDWVEAEKQLRAEQKKGAKKTGVVKSTPAKKSAGR